MDEDIMRHILDAAQSVTRHDMEAAKESLRDAIELIGDADISSWRLDNE